MIYRGYDIRQNADGKTYAVWRDGKLVQDGFTSDETAMSTIDIWRRRDRPGRSD